MKRRLREPLMVRVWCELGAARPREKYISSSRAFVHGTCEAGRIVINPVHMTVDTVIHELLHRLHPKWSENYVRNRTTFLRHQMTESETKQFYDEYQARKRA